jgi:hypothetical protein
MRSCNPATLAWDALLAELEISGQIPESEREESSAYDSGIRRECPSEVPLSERPAGPFRSLGRFLDYTDWPDRDRFLELDRAIDRAIRSEASAQEALVVRRCLEQMPDGSLCLDRFRPSGEYSGFRCKKHREPASFSHAA